MSDWLFLTITAVRNAKDYSSLNELIVSDKLYQALYAETKRK